MTSPLCFPGFGNSPDSCSKVFPWPHLSASSKTTYSTPWSFKFISTATCTNRPGVAMILEGIHRSGHPRSRTPPAPLAPSKPLSGKGPQSITSQQQTHMSGFSCRAANWSSILGEKQGHPERTELWSLSLLYLIAQRPHTSPWDT